MRANAGMYERYSSLFKDLYQLCNNHYRTINAKKICKKHHVSFQIFPHIVRLGYIIKHPNTLAYTWYKKDVEPSHDDLDLLFSVVPDLYHKPTLKDRISKVQSSDIQSISETELIAELKRRGYSGSIIPPSNPIQF